MISRCRMNGSHSAWFWMSVALSLHVTAARAEVADEAFTQLEQLNANFEILMRAPAEVRKKIPPAAVLNRLHELEQRALGKPMKMSSRELVSAANRALNERDYDAGIPLYAEYVVLVEQIYGKDHPRASEGRNSLAEIRRESSLAPEVHVQVQRQLAGLEQREPSGDASAMRQHVQAIRSTRDQLGKLLDDPAHSLMMPLYSLEFANLFALGQFQDARMLTEQQLEINRQRCVEGESKMIQLRINLATILEKQGYYSQAATMLRELESTFPAGITPVGQEAIWNTRAQVLSRAGAAWAARQAIEQYLRLLAERCPWDIRKLVIGLSNQGTILNDGGDPAAAIPILSQAHELALKAGDPITGYRAQLSLAMAQAELFRFDAASREAQASLTARLRLFPEDHPDVLNCRKEFSRIRYRQGDYLAGLELIEAALKAFPANERHRVVYSEAKQIQGALLRKLGRTADALSAFQAAEQFAPQDARTASMPRFTRLSLQVEQGDRRALQEMEQLVEQSGQELKPREAVLAYENLAIGRAQTGDLPNAIRSLDNSRRALFIHRQVNLPGLSHADQLQQVENFFPLGQHHALLEFASRTNDPSLIELTLEWVLNDKGLVHEILANFQRYQRSIAQASDRAKAEELQLLQSSLASAAAAGRALEDSDLVAQSRRAEQLSLELGVAARSAQRTRTWLTVEQQRQKIPQDSVLIELLRTNSPWGQDSKGAYFAWIVPPAGAGTVQLLQLGPATDIDTAVSDFRRTISRMQQSATISAVNRQLREDLQTATKQATSKLGKLIFLEADKSRTSPGLLARIQDYRRWIIAPDAALWLLPWDVLPIQENELVVQKHLVSYLHCGRHLLNPELKAASADAVALFDPEFGEGDYQPVFLPRRARWTQLPATANQAVNAAEFFEELGGRTTQLTGKDATEANLLKSCRAPREMLIATHGYSALADDDAAAALADQPLRFCGIVLASANRRPTGEFDNYLNGEEIARLDLEGSHVFCNVCVGGLGRRQDAQGVASINQAFQLAGAKTLITTLWEVEQQSGTLPLLNTYWKKRSEGAGPEAALRTAKLEILESERHSHPYFWAAYTLAGSTP